MKLQVIQKILVLGAILALLSGCGSKIPDSGLHIYSWNSALGGSDDLKESTYSYSINLTNDCDQAVYIESIQPALNQTIKDKITSDISVDVNKELKAHEAIQIDGEISFDSENLSKADIIKLEPFITDFKIISEVTISVSRK